MSAKTQIAVVVSTYQRPQHLRRCLVSLAHQRGVAGQYEVVVVDDGSRDETAEMVAQFARAADFPLHFTTHEHNGYHLSRCRNAGIRNSTAPYLLFTDGDCIFPADHLRQHLDLRRPGVVRAGHCIRFDEATSGRIGDAVIRSGEFTSWASSKERRLLARTHRKALFYQFIRHAERPKLVGWNIAVARVDLERVNGFDELFRGWGCEDDDLRRRLRRQGARVATSIGRTHGYHLWHAPHSTTPVRWSDGVNVDYYHRPLVLDRCLVGLERRRLERLRVDVLASERHGRLAQQLEQRFPQRGAGPEIELLLWPSGVQFSKLRASRVLVVPAGERAPRAVEQAADAQIRLPAGAGAAEIVRQLQGLLGLQAATAPETRRAVAVA